MRVCARRERERERERGRQVGRQAGRQAGSEDTPTGVPRHLADNAVRETSQGNNTLPSVQSLMQSPFSSVMTVLSSGFV